MRILQSLDLCIQKDNLGRASKVVYSFYLDAKLGEFSTPLLPFLRKIETSEMNIHTLLRGGPRMIEFIGSLGFS